MKTIFKKLAVTTIGLCALGYSQIAQAAQTITFNSNALPSSFTALWSLGIGANDNDGGTNTTGKEIAAHALFDNFNFNSSTKILSFDVKLFNDVVDPISSHNYDIVAMGMYVSPDLGSGGAALLSPTSGIMNHISYDTNTSDNSGSINFPGGFQKIDVCVYANNTCSGGTVNDSIHKGGSDKFGIKLDFSSSVNTNSITLGLFPIKFQTWKGSYEFAAYCIISANEGCINEPPLPPRVPAPLVGVLFALGLGYIGARYRNKK